MARVVWSQQQDVGPTARMGHAMAYDAGRQRVVLFGGDSVAALLGDTWEWDGEDWTQVADTGPDPRGGHQVAFDTTRSRLVLFGGRSAAGMLGDTWEWDGGDWTQVADTGPEARAGHQLAFDADRGQVVLFGGEAAGPKLRGDTWGWDGADWTQLQDIGPVARAGHAMTFDPTRGRVVLFGGDVGGATVGDTWEWDGTTWVMKADFGPKACADAAMTFDGSAALLFGGIGLPAAVNVPAPLSGLTWQWDGQHWTVRQDMGPAPRCGHTVTLDPIRGRAVLFGGVAVDPTDAAAVDHLLGDTWEAAVEGAARVVSLTLNPDTAAVGDQITIVVALSQPAAAGGVSVGVFRGGTAEQLATVTVAAGASSGDAQWVIPADLPAGDVEVEARLAASTESATLHVVAGIDIALVAFTLNPDTLLPGESTSAEVALDQPAPAGDAQVAILSDGNPIAAVTVPEGAVTGQTTIELPAEVPPGDYPLDAQIGTSTLTATLHLGVA